MNIDLLYSEDGEPGLIASQNFVQKIAGVLYSAESGEFTLEFRDMETLELNIPVEESFAGPLHHAMTIHIGACKDGHIAQAYNVPLIVSDNPYGTQGLPVPVDEQRELVAFSNFIKRCVVGQPVHREDLGDEISIASVLGDASPAQLAFAPHLAQRHQLQAAPKAGPSVNVPGFTVPGFGGGSTTIGGAGQQGGGSQGGSGRGHPGGRSAPPKWDDDE